MEKIFRKIRKFAEEMHIIDSGDNILAAVSGGPDSVFLLHFLAYLAQGKNISVKTAYIHHHLRKEAGGELIFVKRLSAGYKFPFYSKDIKIEKTSGIEEEGRIKRYRALHDIAKQAGCNKIAAGHTLDDQAETVLMHLIKGSGLAGLRGMRPVSPLFKNSRICLARPLLCVEKSVISASLEKAGKRYMTDSSNLSEKFFRNRIRRELVPLIKTYNPNAAHKIAVTALLLQDDFSYLEAAAAQAMKAIFKGQGGDIDAAAYRKLDISVKRMLLSLLAEDFKQTPYRSFNNIEKARRRLDKVKSRYISRAALENIIKDLPDEEEIEKPIPESFLKTPGTIFLDGRKIRAVLAVASENIFRNKDRFTCYLDASKTGRVLKMRGYRRGDSLRPLGMDKKKRVSRLFIDRKTPCRERQDCLIFEAKGKIAWVCGFEISEEFKVTEKTKKVLKIQVSQ